MLIPHMLIAGVVEAVFTVAIFSFIKKVSPGTIYEGSKESIRSVYALIAVLICLSPLGLLAAGTAWGEWSADEIKDIITGGKALGYIPQGMENGFNFNVIMPDYVVKGLPEYTGYIISAVAGVAILLIIFKILGSLKKDTGKAAA